MKTKRIKWLAALLLLVAAMVMPATAWAQITPTKPSGKGTSDSPYQIRTAAELYWFAALVNGDTNVSDVTAEDKSAWAVLTADIEVSDTWTPIMEYNGTFDGKGHTISGLTNTQGDFNGLFGTTESNSEIRNVGIVNCEFSATDATIGGVCGVNNGTIKNCFNTGSITAFSSCTGGGVCGWNQGTIENCYNTGNIVDGNPVTVGGVCGENNGIIKNCYNTGSVCKGNISSGVCGNNSGTITNCYYLIGTARGGICDDSADTPGSAESKTAVQFASGEVAWLLNGKKSEGTEENPLAWYQNIDKKEATKDSYPLLVSTHGTVYSGYDVCKEIYSNSIITNQTQTSHNHNNGFCTYCDKLEPATLNTSDQYEIGNAGQLYWFAGLVNGTLDGVSQNKYVNAVLTANIIVNTNVLKADGSIADDVSGFRSWTPIGYYNTEDDFIDYAGTFDGDNHTISGLYLNEQWVGTNGLFGRVNKGCIKNVGVVDSYFNGKLYVGGVCGYAALSTIENCYNKGTVFCMYNAGGVCGVFTNGTISNCYNTGYVNGVGNASPYVGGLCGSFTNSIGLNCYNIGTVGAPAESIGAVFGFTYESNFYNCYYLEGCNAEGTSFTNTLGTSMTQEQFGSGKVCYLLSQGSTVVDEETSTSNYYSGATWGQQLDTDQYPVLGDYKVIRAAQDGLEGTNYWATFSNLDSNAELIAPTGDVTVYNATVSDGKLTLNERSNKVAKGEGVLLKACCEYLNAKNISDEVSAAAIGDNDLVATPATAETITADNDYTLYRLTYDDVNQKSGLGFYLSLIKDANDEVVESSIGKQLKATPGKAYLNVLTSEAKLQSSAAPARGFAFPGDDDITGIECITVTDEELHKNGNAEGIFDLQGRKVSKPMKGVYINNGKKVIIK